MTVVARTGETRFRYHTYGAAVTSDFPLALPGHQGPVLGAVHCRTAPSERFAAARSNLGPADAFHRWAPLADGSTYLGWNTVGEFIVSEDGHLVECCRAEGSPWESFQVYTLGQALSLALVNQGIEPLHATVVVIGGEAIGFLGDSAHGKSTLAASLLSAGDRLLTDDLLVIEESPRGLIAHPGPARIKLFPAIANAYLPCCKARTVMNGGTDKLILPLAPHERCAVPVPLSALFAVTSPRDACRRRDVSIEPLSRRDGFMRLLRATFHRRVVRPSRLRRQFDALAAIADRVGVSQLSYPRSLNRLDEVREAVVASTVGSAAAAMS
jgi:hypothetical protein